MLFVFAGLHLPFYHVEWGSRSNDYLGITKRFSVCTFLYQARVLASLSHIILGPINFCMLIFRMRLIEGMLIRRWHSWHYDTDMHHVSIKFIVPYEKSTMHYTYVLFMYETSRLVFWFLQLQQHFQCFLKSLSLNLADFVTSLAKKSLRRTRKWNNNEFRPQQNKQGEWSKTIS